MSQSAAGVSVMPRTCDAAPRYDGDVSSPADEVVTRLCSDGGTSAPDFRALVDALPTAIYTTDAAGRLTYFNPAAVEFSGRVPQLGSDQWSVSWKLYRPDGTLLPHDECPMARAIAEGRAIYGEEAIAERPDGRRIHFAAFPTPLFDEAGNVVGGVNMLVDITDRKGAAQALIESEERFSRFMLHFPGLAWIKDVAGRYVYANEAARRVFRHADEQLDGKTDYDLFSQKIADQFRDNDRLALADSTGLQVVESLVHDDGVLHESLVSKFPIGGAGGQAQYVGGMALDISELKRAQHEQSRLAAIVESSSDAIVSKDLSGFITSWNRGAEQLFGYTAGEVIGRNITMLIPTDRLPEEAAILARIARNERIDHFETVRRRKDGALVDVSISVSPMVDGQGRIIGASKIARDITDRKRAEEAVARSQSLLEAELADTRLLQSVSAALVQENNIEALFETIIDAAKAVMRSDFASMQMLHRDRGELRLLAFRGFSPQAARHWEWVRARSGSTCGMALATGKRVVATDVEQCEYMAGTDDLATYLQTGIRAVQTTPLISRSGELLGMLSTHWDRPHEPSERDLRLLDILARQAADLIERKQSEDALKLANRKKDEFLAMLAHELRNPLAPIQSALNALHLKPADEDDVRGAAGMMQRHVAQLRRLVDDLLDVSRISRGKIGLHKELVDLAAIAAEAAEAARPLFGHMEHRFEVALPAEPIYVHGDTTRLTQVLANLLNNACKFTPRGGGIDLILERAQDQAIVHVRDTGIGIAAENLRSIFDMFSQVDASLERTREGLGLGLTLVRFLVELHGGAVSVKSDGIGRGSEFIVTLPVATLPAPASDAPSAIVEAAHRATPSRRILIVDDNRDAASSLAKLLKLCGHITQTAFDGEEALGVADDFRPDVLLLDIGLPKLNGYDLCQRIRELPWAADALLVALTGWGQESDRRRSQEAGFDVHLVKPVDLEMLERLLEQSGAKSAAVSQAM